MINESSKMINESSILISNNYIINYNVVKRWSRFIKKFQRGPKSESGILVNKNMKCMHEIPSRRFWFVCDIITCIC